MIQYGIDMNLARPTFWVLMSTYTLLTIMNGVCVFMSLSLWVKQYHIFCLICVWQEKGETFLPTRNKSHHYYCFSTILLWWIYSHLSRSFLQGHTDLNLPVSLKSRCPCQAECHAAACQKIDLCFIESYFVLFYFIKLQLHSISFVWKEPLVYLQINVLVDELDAMLLLWRYLLLINSIIYKVPTDP